MSLFWVILRLFVDVLCLFVVIFCLCARFAALFSSFKSLCGRFTPFFLVILRLFVSFVVDYFSFYFLFYVSLWSFSVFVVILQPFVSCSASPCGCFMSGFNHCMCVFVVVWLYNKSFNTETLVLAPLALTSRRPVQQSIHDMNELRKLPPVNSGERGGQGVQSASSARVPHLSQQINLRTWRSVQTSGNKPARELRVRRLPSVFCIIVSD